MRIAGAVGILTIACALWAAAAQAQQCYRLSDCECAASGTTFLGGAWEVSVAPGVMASSNALNVPFNPDSGLVDIIGTCNGTVSLAYTDRELGLVDWTLHQVAERGDMSDIAALVPEWEAFVEKSAELNSFTDLSQIFVGHRTFNLSIGEAPATLILAYVQDTGRSVESGVGSITMQVGPVNIPGRGPTTFWARTGEAVFQWTGPSDYARTYVRTRCRCSEVEDEARAQIEFRALYRQIIDGYARSDDGRIRPRDGLSLIERQNRDVTATMDPMRNQSFDMSQALDRENNWPCVEVADQIVDGSNVYPEYERGVREIQNQFADASPATGGDHAHDVSDGDAGDADTDRHSHGVAAAGSVGDQCEIHIADNDDYCAKPEIVLVGIRAHEQVHAETCRGADDDSRHLDLELTRLESGAGGEEGIALAREAREANAVQCLASEGTFQNSVIWLEDEIQGTEADLAILAEYVSQYCR